MTLKGGITVPLFFNCIHVCNYILRIRIIIRRKIIKLIVITILIMIPISMRIIIVVIIVIVVILIMLAPTPSGLLRVPAVEHIKFRHPTSPTQQIYRCV